jgi:predicted NBD/HSP70 family sugar kinase
MPAHPAVAAREFRWQGALALIEVMRRQPGITRAQAARLQGLSSGSATEIVARLRGLALLDERPGPAPATGRPSRLLSPHPQGPVVVAADVQYGGWQCAYAGIDGEPHPLHSQAGVEADPERFLTGVRAVISRAGKRFGHRIRAVSLAIAGTVQDDRVVQSAALGWQAVDLSRAVPRGLPLLAGNDATLAGLAEARGGAARAAETSLHLAVQVGVGGVLIVGGSPITGATGAGGEFGHLPFGDPSRLCPCGARGCWDNEVDGRALARQLGDPAPRDPQRYALDIIGRSAHDPAARSAVGVTASALGRGIAGLVNAHDPAVVTLGGLGAAILATTPDALDSAYRAGLMRFRRAQPPQITAATYREDGVLRGALERGLDTVLSETGLDAWSAERAAAAKRSGTRD